MAELLYGKTTAGDNRPVLVDDDGVVAVSGALGGGGGATAAKQDTGNASLASIDGKTPALSGGAVPVTGPLTDTQLRATAVPVSGTVTATGPLTDTQLRATAVPVSAAALPLPTGAATETSVAAVAAVLGTTTGTAVITDAAGAIQQYLRGIIKLIIAKITVILDAGEAHIGEVGGKGLEATDTWTRPADTTAYAANDRVSATTSDTATTALRSLTLARANGGSGYLTYWELISDLTTFLPSVRVHLYTVAAPTTALNGDNGVFAAKYANALQRVGSFDLPALALPAGTGSDLVRAVRDDLRIPFKCAGGDTKLYYAYEILAVATPANAQSFKQIARSDVD